jgi:hypothetical protein
MQVPECEILLPSTHAIKNFIRRGEFFKMMSSMETGAEAGMWTYTRYRTWLDTKKTWHTPGERPEESASEEMPVIEDVKTALPPITIRTPSSAAPSSAPAPAASSAAPGTPSRNKEGLLEIEPEEGGLAAIITQLKNKP